MSDENVLLTGSPGVGKTTVVERLVERVREHGAEVRGVFSPEIRDEDGERVGFRITDVSTGRSEVMAHIEYEGTSVGKYGVDVQAVEAVAREAIVTDADLVVVDEIAPMETHSDVFVESVRTVLDSETPVVGVVQEGRDTGFVGSVKERDDTTLVRVTEENRDEVPDDILSFVFKGRDSPQTF